MVNQPAKHLLEKHGILNIRIHSIKNALQYNAVFSIDDKEDKILCPSSTISLEYTTARNKLLRNRPVYTLDMHVVRLLQTKYL